MNFPLIYIVHGSNAHTWWRRLANGGYAWWRRWSLFSIALRRTFGECTIRDFRWSGENTHEARLRAGADLAEAVVQESGRRSIHGIHIVGHSHGANVAVAAADRLPQNAIQTLILLAHPNMSLTGNPGTGPEWLYWGAAAERVPRIWNLYSPEDRVQCALVQRFHGIPFARRDAVRVSRVFEGRGCDFIRNESLHWDNARAAHRAMHSSPVGAVIGAILRGAAITDALNEAGLRRDKPNTVPDRGGWPGLRKTQELIALRADPSPFDMGGNKADTGILFVHGFTASPAETRPMAEYLASEHGWHCRGMLLPGHGTTIADMKQTSSDAWVAAVEEEFDRLAKTCRHVFLAGLSLGATLCCHVALRQRANPRLGGLILMAPAFGVSGRKTLALRFLRRILKSRPKTTRATDFFLDHHLFNYVENPLDRVADLLRLGDEAVKNLGMLRQTPLLLFAGDLESTVSLKKILRAVHANPWIRFVQLPHSRHILPLEPDRESMFETSATFIEESLKP